VGVKVGWHLTVSADHVPLGRNNPLSPCQSDSDLARDVSDLRLVFMAEQIKPSFSSMSCQHPRCPSIGRLLEICDW
jgi:hypothetical protein